MIRCEDCVYRKNFPINPLGNRKMDGICTGISLQKIANSVIFQSQRPTPKKQYIVMYVFQEVIEALHNNAIHYNTLHCNNKIQYVVLFQDNRLS